MKLPYSYDVTVNGFIVGNFCDIEVTLEIECDWHDGSIDVVGIYLDTFQSADGRLFEGAPVDIIGHDNPVLAALADAIKAKAESDRGLSDTAVEKAMKEEGVCWSGRGANDPSGRFVRFNGRI